jgi:hypothetical protein
MQSLARTRILVRDAIEAFLGPATLFGSADILLFIVAALRAPSEREGGLSASHRPDSQESN